jgi:hypothetical protein
MPRLIIVTVLTDSSPRAPVAQDVEKGENSFHKRLPWRV